MSLGRSYPLLWYRVFILPQLPRGGGYSPNIWVEVCGALTETFTLFQPKYAIFPTLFHTCPIRTLVQTNV